ncbi:MAG: hypothetical protein PQJ46_09350 [Spirochaetales bacterium]|nr:hypothetical protein [Spirochaetales bacterium]
MIELNRKQIAQLRGCSPSTVSRAKLEKTGGGGYDLKNPEVWAYVTEPVIDEAIAEYKKYAMEGYEDQSLEGLEAEERKANIALKRKRERDLDLKFAREKKDLIPSSLMSIWIGYFATGIRNNFLTIAIRVARNNKPLRDKIEKEISKAINKTLDTAEKELEKHSEEIAKAMRTDD